MDGATSIHQTTTFADITPAIVASPKPVSDSTRTLTDQSADSLSSFLGRPIQIGSYTWTPGTAFTAVSFAPWDQFFSNPRVTNRISNYALINCTLRVKITVNGNSFYWGLLMADWQAYKTLDSISAITDSSPYATVTASQRPKIFIDPTTSSGGELHLPFIMDKNSIDMTTSYWSTLGSINIRQVVQLAHANASVQPVTLNVFAWAEDVHLSIPTSVNCYALTAQAGEADETRTVKLSSTVAAVANALSSVPGIAPFAMATSMVATSLGQVARLFGFSRPVSLAEPTAVRPRYFGVFATTDAADSCDKLTVTSKQELTIDPRVVGVDLGDELVISDIAGRETYFNQFGWSSGSTNGALLYNYRVTPMAIQGDGTINFPTAAYFAARPFAYWRGTMRYRFVFVASGFHKGRVRIVWDPRYIATVGATELNTNFTRIVDLDVEREVTIDVPWGSNDAFLLTGSGLVNTNGATASRFTTIGPANGVIAMYVQGQLAAANNTVTSVTVATFVSCPDLCVAEPDEQYFSQTVDAYSYVPQSDEQTYAPTSDGADQSLGDGDCDENMMKVFFGERVVSFRQLLKRYQLHSIFKESSATPGVWSIVNSDFPQYKGYSPNALHVTSTAKKINYVQSTLLNYLAPAFLAMRGSIRSKYHMASAVPGSLQSFSVERASPLTAPAVGETFTPWATTDSDSSFARLNSVTRRAMYGGGAVTAPEQQPVLEVEHPYYRNIRFDLTRRLDNPSAYCKHIVTCLKQGTASHLTLTRYIATGEDFTLVYFQGAPPFCAFPDALLPVSG